MRCICPVLLWLLFTLKGFAQLMPVPVKIIPDKIISRNSSTDAHHKRTVQCGPDTVYYAYAKASSIRGLSINNSTSADKVAQWFDAQQPMFLHGFTFFAWQSFGTTDTVALTCSAVLAGSDSFPTGPVAATTTVKADTTFGNGMLTVLEKTAMFSSPVLLNFPFCLVVENASPISVGLVASDWDSADGGLEWLSAASIPGSGWLHGYDLNVGGTVFDADFLFQPIISYNVDASFTTDTNCIPHGGTVIFDNTSDNPILLSRFYNQHIFDGNDSLVYAWNFGDGSPAAYVFDAMHTFSAGTDYEVRLSANMLGWTQGCTESQTTTINPLTTAEFYYTLNGLNASFTNLSAHADSCRWSFGDGTYGLTFSPIHTYPAKANYEAELICFGLCNNDTFQIQVFMCDSVSSDFNYTITGNTVSFSVSTISGSASFRWNFGDGGIGSGISVNHAYSSNGNFTVCLVASNDCMADTTCKVIEMSATGGDDPDSTMHLRIYPNPVNNTLTIQFGNQQALPENISLFNHIGQNIKTLNRLGTGTLQMDVSEFPPGIYLLIADMPQKKRMSKVLLSR